MSSFFKIVEIRIAFFRPFPVCSLFQYLSHIISLFSDRFGMIFAKYCIAPR